MIHLSSLYLHFPFCRHLCNYCDFFKSVPNDVSDFENFEKYLQEAFNEHAKILDQNEAVFAPLETIYLGGGTPSLWGARGADFLGEFFHKNSLKLAPGVEFTMEVNPGQYTPLEISQWEAIGVNRFSVGLQSVDPKFLKHLDRLHTLKESKDAQIYFGEKENVSFDLMLGLPYSERGKRDVLKELEEILLNRPKHLSLYILTTKSTYLHKAVLPGEEFIAQEYLKVSDYLIQKGFDHYEVSNFGLPGKYSSHNMRYWDLKSMAALGPSATGLLTQGDKALRYKWNGWNKDPSLEKIDKEAYRMETFYLGMRTNTGLSLNFPFLDQADGPRFKALALSWVERDLASLVSHRVKLTSRGYLVLDSLMDEAFNQLKSL